MQIIHLHTGSDGKSHFADLDLRLSDGPGGGALELLSGVQGLAFRDVPSGFSNDYHTAPRRQIVLQLSGMGELICGDGSSRIVGPGDILLVDDLTGQGHRSREVAAPRSQLCIYLDPNLDLRTLVAD